MDSITDIQCPACKTIFKVDISKIPEKGCQANCKKCKKPFFVARPPTPTAPKKVTPKPAARPLKKATPVSKKSEQKAAPASKKSERKAVPVKKTPVKKSVPANRTPVNKAPETQTAKTGKKKNFLLIGSSAVLILLICGGAVFFLMQKYNFQVTAKNDDPTSANETAPDTIELSAVAQPAVVTAAETENDSAADNSDVSIGDLFNRVNPAVATVLTYDSGNNLFKQGSGFFISQDGKTGQSTIKRDFCVKIMWIKCLPVFQCIINMPVCFFRLVEKIV